MVCCVSCLMGVLSSLVLNNHRPLEGKQREQAVRRLSIMPGCLQDTLFLDGRRRKIPDRRKEVLLHIDDGGLMGQLDLQDDGSC